MPKVKNLEEKKKKKKNKIKIKKGGKEGWR
jgi:hypothetical protein